MELLLPGVPFEQNVDNFCAPVNALLEQKHSTSSRPISLQMPRQLWALHLLLVPSLPKEVWLRDPANQILSVCLFPVLYL